MPPAPIRLGFEASQLILGRAEPPPAIAGEERSTPWVIA